MTAMPVPADAAMFHVARRPLTRGQVQVLERAVMGDTMDEIAARFGVGRSAVEQSLQGARRRLGARNTAHLCAVAIALGLVDAAPLQAAAEFWIAGRR